MNSRCRGCSSKLENIFFDLGSQPVANELKSSKLECELEVRHPLKVFVCDTCSLVQLGNEINRSHHFNSNYSYYSSYSSSWLRHAKVLAIESFSKFEVSKTDLVVEVASNDGYLLRNFKALGAKVLGVEPSSNVASVAVCEHKIPTIVEFFGIKSAQNILSEWGVAKLIFGLNVLAHVPNIFDFLCGVKILLDKDGVAIFEFPHLNSMIQQVQFDTIYHEHYSYLSLTALNPILKKVGLVIYDVEKIETHGGSLRTFVCRIDSNRPISTRVAKIITEEFGLSPLLESVKFDFNQRVNIVCTDLINEVAKLKLERGSVVGYGAAAKGATLLNFIKFGKDDIPYIVDLNTFKQGKFCPGSHIPIQSLDHVNLEPPGAILILPWNISQEIATQLRNSGIKVPIFRAIPRIKYFQ